MISCNSAMSIDCFNDNFCSTISGSNSIDDDIVGGDNVIDREDNGNDGDNKKEGGK